VENRFIAAKHIAWLGIIANIVLLCLKLAVGYANNSQAMIADGFNSTGDVCASVITLFGSIFAAKPKDNNHNFGHGKAEFLASLLIGFFMAAIAIYTISSSVDSLLTDSVMTYSFWLIAVAITTIAVKTALYIYSIRKAKKYNSLLIKANAQDHRNDIFVTAGTLLSVLMSIYGFNWADGVVGITISGWIIYTGIRIIIDSSKILMDESVQNDTVDQYRSYISSADGIDHIDSIAVKPVGAKYVVIVKISVDKNMTVAKSHEIAKSVENELINRFSEIDDVIVHINPDFPHTP